MQHAPPVPMDHSTMPPQPLLLVLLALITNVRLAMAKMLDNAKLATMVSLLSAELAEPRLLPPPKELHQLLEVLDTIWTWISITHMVEQTIS